MSLTGSIGCTVELPSILYSFPLWIECAQPPASGCNVPALNSSIGRAIARDPTRSPGGPPPSPEEPHSPSGGPLFPLRTAAEVPGMAAAIPTRAGAPLPGTVAPLPGRRAAHPWVLTALPGTEAAVLRGTACVTGTVVALGRADRHAAGTVV